MKTQTTEEKMLGAMLYAVEFGFRQHEMGRNLLYAKSEFIKAWNGQDPHRQKAAEMFKVPYDKVTDAQRRAAKAAAFGELYGSLGTNTFEVRRKK